MKTFYIRINIGAGRHIKTLKRGKRFIYVQAKLSKMLNVPEKDVIFLDCW